MASGAPGLARPAQPPDLDEPPHPADMPGVDAAPPPPRVRALNVRPPEPSELEPDTQLFAEEGSAEGCASGDCLPDAPPEPADEPPPPPVAPGGRDDLSRSSAERWRAAVEAVRSASPRHGASLANGRLLFIRPGEVGLGYPKASGFHRSTISAATGRQIVERALSEHFGRATKLHLEELADGAAAPLSIAEEETQLRQAHTRSTEGEVRAHPSVRAVLKLLGGEIEHIQVLEPERPAPAAAVTATDTGPDESA